ncbi:MAG: lysoplasmalogenase [Hyphococcus sp.]
MAWTSILICTGALAALLAADACDRESLRWVFKPLASAAFIAFALQCGALDSAYGRLILIGLVFCFAGDVLLIASPPAAFLAGMGAFAAGHIAYAGAFMHLSAGFTAGALIAGGVTLAVIGIILRQLWPHLGVFRAPVSLYCAIIGAMTAVSFTTLAPGSGAAPYWPAAAGAVAFAVSDISVARDQFVKSQFFNRVWGLPLYYGAQLLLARSVSL